MSAFDYSHLNLSQVLKNLNISVTNYLGTVFDKFFLYLTA